MNRRRLITGLLIFDVIVAVLAVVWWNQREPSPKTTPTTVPMNQAETVATPDDPSVTHANPKVPVVGPSAEPAADPVAEGSAPLPTASAGAREWHGTFRGQPFWMRLSLPDPEFNGNRRLDIVYTPTPAAQVEGSMIHDSPILVVDDHLQLVRWDNRDGATGVLRQAEPDAYLVQREVRTADEKVTLLKRVLVFPKGWPLEVAPLLALIAEGDTWSIPVIDCWGERALDTLSAERNADGITIAGTTYTLVMENGLLVGLDSEEEQLRLASDATP